MNHSMIRYVLGAVLCFESLFLLLPMIIGFVCGEQSAVSFLICAVACMVLGGLMVIRKPKRTDFYATEGFVSVAVCWIAMSLFGALPFFISREIPRFEDAMFEAISGFTTTGASILNDVEALSKCCLFWRSFTHWIGGMGGLATSCS